MTLSGKHLLAAEALDDALDLLDEATRTTREATANLDSQIQTSGERAATAAAAGVTARVVAAEQAATSARDAALAVTAAGTNHVPTAADLSAGAADGSVTYVDAEGLIYRKAAGAWAPDFLLSAAKYGSVLSSSIYALAVQDIAGQITPQMFRAAHQALAAGRPLRIAFAGDSITARGDISPWGRDAWADRVVDALRAAMPKLTIEVANFGLGGRQLAQMVDPNYKGQAAEPSDLNAGFYRPDWPGWTVGKSWRDHIQAWNPDILLIAHGMNDASRGFAGVKKFRDDMLGFLNDMKGWASNPDPVLVSTFEPTNRPDSIANPQKYVRAYANATVNIARRLGLPLIDAHRLDRILRGGGDGTLTQSRPLLRWEGLETQSEWTWDPARWTISRTNSGPLDPSSLAPSNTDSNPRSVMTRRMAAGGVLIVDTVATNASVIGWIEVLHRPDEDTGLVALLTPAGSSNGSPRVAIINRANGDVLAEQAITWNVGQTVSLRWTWTFGRHTIVVTDGAGAQSTVQFDALHAAWEGGVRFSAAGGAFGVPEYRNLQLYLWEPLGTDRVAPVVREREIMGVYPIRWPATSGNNNNHPDNAGGAFVYLGASLGLVRALAALPGLPLDVSGGGAAQAAALIMQNGWAAFGAGYATPRVTKRSGQLSVSGLIRVPSGAAYPATVAQLPAGFRPTTTEFLTMRGNGNSSGPLSVVWAQAEPNGNLVLLAGPPYANGEQFVDLKTIMEVY